MAEGTIDTVEGVWDNYVKKHNSMDNILSLHGYNTSHDSGFEKALKDDLNKDHNFISLDLLGHAPGRIQPQFASFKDVISRALYDLKGYIGQKSILIGTSFGAYPILYSSTIDGSNVKGIVLVKPVVDLEYTLSRPNERLEPLRGILRPQEAIESFEKRGTPSNPLDVSEIPTLLFYGQGDQVVSDPRIDSKEFMEKRIKGSNVNYFRLRGVHYDNNSEDLKDVVEETRKFLSSLR